MNNFQSIQVFWSINLTKINACKSIPDQHSHYIPLEKQYKTKSFLVYSAPETMRKLCLSTKNIKWEYWPEMS